MTAAVLLSSASVVQAQSIGDRVGGHVNDNLKNGKKGGAKPKHHPGHGHSHAPPPPARQGPAPPPPPPPPKPKGPELPYRVLGGKLQLDPSVGVAYRGWRPQSYPSIDVSTENALTWSVGGRAKLGFISLERAHYESTGAASPRHSGASVAQQAASYTPAAAWVIGAIGFPFNWVLEPIIRYEARAFESTLTPKKPIRLIPRSASKNDNFNNFPATTEKLTLVSSFETFVVALKYHHDNDPTGIISSEGDSFPSIYLGIGLTQYSKPYMVRVGNAVLDDLLFDARLRGGGLALGLETPQKPERFFVDFSGQVGIGEVRLMQDYTVNEELPKGWLIGYTQGELTGGYLHPILRTRPTLLGGIAASVGGATFFYFKPLTTSGEQTNTPALNWDLLWGIRVFLVLPL